MLPAHKLDRTPFLLELHRCSCRGGAHRSGAAESIGAAMPYSRRCGLLDLRFGGQQHRLPLLSVVAVWEGGACRMEIRPSPMDDV